MKSRSKAVDGDVSAGLNKPGTRVRAKRAVKAKIDSSPGSVVAPLPAKRVRNYKKHAKKELSQAFPEIVDVLIERAKKGSVTHAKFLFEIGGVKDEPVVRGSRKRPPSLAEILLREVAKRSETPLEAGSPEHGEGQAYQHAPRAAADLRSEDKG